MGFVEFPRGDIALANCWWYHSMDFPDGTSVVGDWDLRGRFDDYTGRVSVAGKRVLDVGTASGFLAFGAELHGAKVVSFDMEVNGNWDTVPYADEPIAGMDAAGIEARLRVRRVSEATRYRRADAISPMRNGFFYARRKYASSVQLFEGSVYDISHSVGIFDVSLVGAILLHLRDPFLALHRIAQITTRQLVISDLCDPSFRRDCGDKPLLAFLPDETYVHTHAWWRLSPGALDAMLRVVGFRITSESTGTYKFKGHDHTFVTLVADRVTV